MLSRPLNRAERTHDVIVVQVPGAVNEAAESNGKVVAGSL